MESLRRKHSQAEKDLQQLKFRGCAKGYVVMALEHTDGSGSTAKMAGKRPPLFFSGWMSDEDRPRQIR